MNPRITITVLSISIIFLFYTFSYTSTPKELPKPHDTIVYCGSETITTSFESPTTLSSNAIIGKGYTYYYSDIIIISGTTCTVKHE